MPKEPKEPKLKSPVASSAVESAAPRFLPVLAMLFVGSGCAALIYEVVWFQLLQLTVGSSAVSMGVLLATYMGGMCVGSLALPRFFDARQHPLRVYAMLEAGIGIFGILVLLLMPLVDSLYAAIGGPGFFGILLRAVVAAICLLPPTLLMGASLPAASRWVESRKATQDAASTQNSVSWMGFLYGSNIAGAVFGCLFAGFYLLRIHDMPTATFIAAAINFGVAGISYILSGRTKYTAPVEDQARVERPVGARAIYIAIGLSGLTALGAEVIWARLLSLMLGATVYTFSIILGVFLVGLGIGSTVGSFLAKHTRRPRLLLGCCQMLLAGAIAWTAWVITGGIPNWPINPLLSRSPWYTFQIDLVCCAWAMLPAALLWGASFPLALASVAGRDRDPGRLVGETYAANTVGAILGSLAFSLFLVPWIGTQGSERLLILIAVISAFVVFWQLRAASTEAPLRGVGFASLAVATAAALVLIVTVDDMPWIAVAYGRRMSTTTNAGEPLYRGEGRNSSIVISRLPDGKIYFHVSGKVEASTEPFDMRLQRMLGHIPALLHPEPKSVLIVGFGAGVTAGSFVVHPKIERIQICEIEPLIPPASTQYFSRENYNVLNDSRTRIAYDDARHFILTSKDKFDVITSDPIHPWVKGTATLYSTEYFELCKRHLNPGGVVTQWVPLYESDPETVKSELATFFKVFPNGTIWGNPNGGGYDVLLLGHNEPLRIDIDALQQRLESPAHGNVARSLREVGFRSSIDLLATYAGRASDLAPWLVDAEINRDRNLRLQYLAGMGVNSDRAARIYDDMLSYLKFPTDMIGGSDAAVAMLKEALRAQASR
ncbi:MAG TPA: fused MFS/spermidine synthase [Bryobacteraceae bacterium]|nr:fused MFS/spermidine synthase [Bryobacteraceae bacterium]